MLPHFPRQSPAYKNRCASVITKAHHRASLTGGQHHAAQRHRATEAQRRIRAGDSPTALSLFSVSRCLRASVLPPPPRTRRTIIAKTAERTHRKLHPLGVLGVLAIRLPAPNAKCAKRTNAVRRNACSGVGWGHGP